MPIMITGAKGMLGRHLAETCSAHTLGLVDLGDFDLANPAATDKAVREFKPKTVIHCAAMTAVDKAESDEETAYRANALGSANIAGACHRSGARLIAISTDYVFAGDLDRPYHEWDPVGPKSAYGRTKLAGEEAIRTLCPDHLICRIAWLYGAGGPSFVHSMIKFGSESGPPMKVVHDQIGNPTSALAVAERLAQLVEQPLAGTIHLTCSGDASWYDFAKQIFALWGLKRELVPCTTAEFPRPAPRPANSRLEKRVLQLAGLPPMPDWRDALKAFHHRYPNG